MFFSQAWRAVTALKPGNEIIMNNCALSIIEAGIMIILGVFITFALIPFFFSVMSAFAGSMIVSALFSGNGYRDEKYRERNSRNKKLQKSFMHGFFVKQTMNLASKLKLRA